MSSRYTPLLCILALLGLLIPTAVPSSASLPVPKKTIRVMTFNIHTGVGVDKKLDLQRIADVIIQESPDLVGLQEVDRGVRRTEGIDEIAELAKMTRMDYAFGYNLDYQEGQYGIAILSKSLIQKIDHRKYQNRREAERRGMLRVEVDIGGRMIDFVTTHLDYQHDDDRLFETEQLLKFLADVKNPLIVVGDFNDEPDGSAYKLMATKFVDSWIGSRAKGDGFSYSADKATKRIDYIFYRTSDDVRARKVWVVRTPASDHLPVMAELEIRWR
jgi:endonuclease/exonuclease/phosphatase family metal-dependent hydrolase